MTNSLNGRTILLAGGTSAAGRAAARALLAAGAHVIVAAHDPEKLEVLAGNLPGLVTEVCDLTDESAVHGFAERVHATGGPVDGILHLVGGWRGGGGLAAQTEEDFRFLEGSLTALRHVSRAFDADVRASPAGREAIVSSTALVRPLAGGANYAAVKAASEAWTRALAHGFAKAARDAGEPLRAASVIFRVTTLDGLEDALADAYIGLFARDAESVNDSVIDLSS
ncbi:SDR family oxidoreductase [Microbacterium deminutum]|uniref:SDR family oxidoreductase n=1 Tax=Microbacterium deminutum TaxID=344164 RepID=A0ABP5BFC2_9MICO